MTYKRIFRAAMTAGLSAALGLGLSACSRDYTADYVYTVSASSGNINAFGVDYQSGVLTPITGSPFTDQFQSNTTVVAAPNGKYIYAISGPQDSKVAEIAVGTDGKLYMKNQYSLGSGSSFGTYPSAAAIDTTGTYLYVTFTYQPGFTPALPGPGGITIFPINSDNSLGTPVTENNLPYVPVGNNPVAIAVSAPTCSTTPVIPGNSACTGSNGAGHINVFVYVVDQEAPPYATVLGFAQNTSTGALTPLSGTSYNDSLKTYQGYSAGVTPSALAIDPTARYVYVTDKTSNQIYGFSIDPTGSGNLIPLISSPYGTGLFPVNMEIDPRGKYLYTVNYNSSTVSSFAINIADGALSGVASSSFATQAQPTCVTIDPALGTYLYTSNYLGGSISGGQLSTNTGSLSAVANSPFPVSSLPACIVSVPNGAHASQINNP